MVVGGVLLERGLHLVGQGRALGGHLGLAAHLRQDLGGLAQRRHGEEVRRHEEQEGRGIIRRTERRGDQSHGIHRIALAGVADRIELPVGHAQEGVGAHALLALLLAERAEDVLDGGHPVFVEDRRVTGHLPVLVGQTDRVAERVDLPLALVKFGAHVGLVAHPLVIGIRVLGVEEGVSVGIQLDALELAADHAGDHVAQLLVLVGQLHVRPHLGARVTEPHGMDVTRVDHRVVLAVLVLARPTHGRVERVREAVLEHPRQAGVGQHALHAGDLGLDGLRRKETVALGRTVCLGILLRRRTGHPRIVGLHHNLRALRHAAGGRLRSRYGSGGKQRGGCHANPG